MEPRARLMSADAGILRLHRDAGTRRIGRQIDLAHRWTRVMPWFGIAFRFRIARRGIGSGSTRIGLGSYR